ncbi:MAG: site-specific integrase [Bacteroidota bacterium]
METFEAVPGSRLDLHRDMFVFSCYAGGLRVSDVLLLQWSNFDGTHIHFTIRKTEDQHALKLPNTALAIVRKYMDASENNGRFIFPMLPADLDLKNYVEVDRKISGATAYINKNLKIIADRTGIKKNLHFHISRHTFCCLALKMGLGIEFVSRLVGHSSIRQTQVYAKLVSKELDEAMDRFNS